MVLTSTRIAAGVWEGVLTDAGTSAPTLRATHLGVDVPGLTVTGFGEASEFLVRIPIPLQAITDSIQTILISDAATGDRLGSFALMAGEALDGDLRAEIDLMRAELDMLKRAFRRHCAETA
jgi:hypothetical protein